jgi:anti-sigma B factor antagonist
MSTVDRWPQSLAGPETSTHSVELSELRIRVEHQIGESFLALYGELDLTSSPALDRELHRAIEASPTIVVDLSALQFIDSTGLRSVVVAARRAESMHRNLRFLRPPPEVARMLALTGVDDVLRYLD